MVEPFFAFLIAVWRSLNTCGAAGGFSTVTAQGSTVSAVMDHGSMGFRWKAARRSR
jgi:hypothetical protein